MNKEGIYYNARREARRGAVSKATAGGDEVKRRNIWKKYNQSNS